MVNIILYRSRLAYSAQRTIRTAPESDSNSKDAALAASRDLEEKIRLCTGFTDLRVDRHCPWIRLVAAMRFHDRYDVLRDTTHHIIDTLLCRCHDLVSFR